MPIWRARPAMRPGFEPGHGRNSAMSDDWRVLYRDHLDCDRTTRSVASKEAALDQARSLHLDKRASIYKIEGPGGACLPREDIMRWLSENRR